MVAFRWPAFAGKAQYTLEIARGIIDDKTQFARAKIVTKRTASHEAAVMLDSFSCDYTWRVFVAGAKPLPEAGFHHFRTGMQGEFGASNLRLRVIHNTGKLKDGLIFSDGAKAIFDMRGKLVWHLPRQNGFITPQANIADMKLSPQGTITFLLNEKAAYEVDFGGNTLWTAPAAGSPEGSPSYHHEFTRLQNGHYMVFGSEFIYTRHNPDTSKGAPLYQFSEGAPFADKGGEVDYFPYSTLLEYDETGRVVWKWRQFDYLKQSDLYYQCPSYMRGNSYDPHPNAFAFDEAHNNIYISFKNVSRVIKIKYPEGTVTASYGEQFKRGVREKGNPLFNGQHGVKQLKNGMLAVYNNNVFDSIALPKITVMKEPAAGGALQKVWEYTCNYEGIGGHPLKTVGFTRGGNVQELPGGMYFVSMNLPFGKVFIVDQHKQIVWSAVFEHWNVERQEWEMQAGYRCSVVADQTAIERMVLGSLPN